MGRGKHRKEPTEKQLREGNLSKKQSIYHNKCRVCKYNYIMGQRQYSDAYRDILTDLGVMCSLEVASTDRADIQVPDAECCWQLGKHQDDQLSPSRNLASMPMLCYNLQTNASFTHY